MPLDQAARGINHLIFAFHSRAFNVCSQNLAQQPSVNFSSGSCGSRESVKRSGSRRDFHGFGMRVRELSCGPKKELKAFGLIFHWQEV